jgi:hypothetical protein
VRGSTITHPLLVSASDALTMAIENSDPWRTVLGTAFTRAGREEVGLSSTDLLKHAWILGKSRKGKSSTLFTIAQSLMLAGEGLAVIDPHGDLSQDLLNAIPSSRVRDLVYIDPTSEHLVTFNPVANVPKERIASQAANVLAAFKAVWSASWGPRLERVLYAALAALTEAPSTTLVGLPKFLKDDRYRARILAHVSDPIVRSFFEEEYDAWNAEFRASALDPVLNKVEQLISSADARATLGTVTSSIEFSEIMDKRKVLVANLAKGRLGPLHAQLLGAMLISAFQQSALARALDHRCTARVPFHLMVDELQNFTTDNFAEILSESAKYGLALIAANQYTDQMPKQLRSALLGNVSTLIAFELASEDAELIGPEIGLRREAASLLTDLKVGEVWMRHATYGGPLHVYMDEPRKGDGRWKTSAMTQHVMRNTYERSRVDEKINAFLSRAPSSPKLRSDKKFAKQKR